VLRPSIFVLPCEPIQRDRPPKGEAWLHEVKFDGYRMQLHKAGRKVTIFSRNGHDWSDRFPRIAAELAALQTCVIDAELVATDATGVTDFATLRRTVSKRQEDGLALCAFDLLYARGRDIRAMPYIERKKGLANLLARADIGALRHSEYFADGDRLLAVCGARGLEGIVSKRRDSAYRSGKQASWIKVKCQRGARPTGSVTGCLTEGRAVLRCALVSRLFRNGHLARFPPQGRRRAPGPAGWRSITTPP